MAPSGRPLRFPQDRPADAARGILDSLDNVRPLHALGDGQDLVLRAPAQQGLNQRVLPDIPKRLSAAGWKLLRKIRDLSSEARDLPVALANLFILVANLLGGEALRLLLNLRCALLA